MPFKIKFQTAEKYIVFGHISYYKLLNKIIVISDFFREHNSRCLLMVIEFFWHNPQKEQSRRRYLLSSAHCQKILTKKQQFSFLITQEP